MPPRHSRSVPPSRGPIAPVHRGPQAAAIPASVALPLHAPNAALLIDFDNVTMGIRSDLASELKTLLSSEIVRGKVSVQRAYADWRRYPQYIVPLTESSIDLIFAPAYGSSKKNATDIRLAIDALELVFTRPEIGTFILLSGDSDFSSLVLKLKEYGKYVIGVGIRESASDLLVQNCDEYYSYNTLAGLVNTRDEEVVKWDPWELAAEAVQRMKRNGDVMRADRLKQVMQQIDSSFDEKNLGMSKFSRFVSEAAHRGIIALHKMENGQFEVDLPRTASGTSSEAGAPESAHAVSADTKHAKRDGHRESQRDDTKHAESKSDDEERRGRGRSRRGRGRGREDRTRDERPRAEHARSESRSEQLEMVPEAPPAEVTSVETPVAAKPAANDGIGAGGMRLTRDEAFDLIRRAVASIATDSRPARASDVRVAARELLGRDSESLNERNFSRILKDAHDADIIDLRRRGDDYDVAPAALATSIADQLGAAEQAQTRARAASETPATPRGVGHRGVSARGRGLGGKPAPLPIDLLSIGVVDEEPAGAPVGIPLATMAAVEDAAEPASNGAKPQSGARAKKATAKKAASKTAGKTAATKTPAKAAAAKKTSRAKK